MRAIALRKLAAYTLASGGALAIDLAVFMALLTIGINAPGAAASGYAAGIAAHWLASSRVVFVDQLAPRGRPRRAQQGLFVATALIGLAITWAIVALGTLAGFDPRLAKLGAVGASFLAIFLLRLQFVFGERRCDAAVADRWPG